MSSRQKGAHVLVLLACASGLAGCEDTARPLPPLVADAYYCFPITIPYLAGSVMFLRDWNKEDLNMVVHRAGKDGPLLVTVHTDTHFDRAANERLAIRRLDVAIGELVKRRISRDQIVSAVAVTGRPDLPTWLDAKADYYTRRLTIDFLGCEERMRRAYERDRREGKVP